MGARDSSGEVLGRNMLTAAGQLGEYAYSCRSVGGICLQLQVSWGNICLQLQVSWGGGGGLLTAAGNYEKTFRYFEKNIRNFE